MVRVAVYCRVSGRAQAKTATIDTQLAVCEAYCKKNGVAIVGRYLDPNVRSITPMTERPEGGRLLRDAESGEFEVVLVYNIDRLSRYREVSDPTLRRLKELGIAFDSATEDLNVATKEGRLMYAVKMAFAELERDTIEQRMRDGRFEWAARTWEHTDGHSYSYWTGGLAPYGYRVVEVNRRRALIPNEEPMACGMSEAEVIRRIYRWAADEGASYVVVIGRLMEMGVPTHSNLTGKGRRDEAAPSTLWRPSSVGAILRRPIYKGVDNYGGVQQRVIPIVSVDQWDRAQSALKDRRRYSNRNAKTLYLLRGKIRCACGYSFTGAPWYRHNKRVEGLHRYICCAKQAPELLNRGRCERSPRLHGPDLDALVWADVLHFIRHPGDTLNVLRATLIGTENEASTLTREMDALRRQVDRKRAALRNLITMRADGEINRDEYLEQKADYEAAVLRVEAQIERLTAQITNQGLIQTRLQSAEALLRSLQVETQGEWTAERKQEIVRRLVRQVYVDGTEITITYAFDPPGVGDTIPRCRDGICCIDVRHSIGT